MLQTKGIAITKNWLGRKGLQFLEMLTFAEKESGKNESLFNTLVEKFKLQYNETMKLFQFWKLARQGNENAEEWIGRLWLAVVQC